jgi:hypothetical protein
MSRARLKFDPTKAKVAARAMLYAGTAYSAGDDFPAEGETVGVRKLKMLYNCRKIVNKPVLVEAVESGIPEKIDPVPVAPSTEEPEAVVAAAIEKVDKPEAPVETAGKTPKKAAKKAPGKKSNSKKPSKQTLPKEVKKEAPAAASPKKPWEK